MDPVAQAQAAYIAALQAIITAGAATQLRAQLATLQQQIAAAEGPVVANARAQLARFQQFTPPAAVVKPIGPTGATGQTGATAATGATGV